MFACDLDGSCSPIGHCSMSRLAPKHCVSKPHGASCEPVSTATSKDVDEVKSINSQASITTAQSKYKECTSDHRGVRTCDFGFCYVVPGDWCKASESCHADCQCCKKKLLSPRFLGQPDPKSFEDEAVDVTTKEWTCSRWNQINLIDSLANYLTLLTVVGSSICADVLLKCDQTGHWQIVPCNKCVQRIGGDAYCGDGIQRRPPKGNIRTAVHNVGLGSSTEQEASTF